MPLLPSEPERVPFDEVAAVLAEAASRLLIGRYCELCPVEHAMLHFRC